MRILKLFVVLVVLVLSAAAARRFNRFIPPFEQGVHASTVDPHLADVLTSGPRVGACPLFPADNVWNTPVDRLQLDGHSKQYVESIGSASKVHPDFGSNLQNGIPFSEIPKGTKRVQVSFEYRDESDLGNYPIPPDAPVEGGASSVGDRHVLLVDPRTCMLYELFAANKQADDTWKVAAGIKMDLTDNALRQDGKTSGDAAGLPILPGLVRYDEVATGQIRHALRFTIPHTQAAHIWPARHHSSHSNDPHLPPMGVRFRLRQDYDISHFSKTNQVILTALKRYGMILADNGSSMFVSGVPDKRWDDSDLHHLGEVTAADFEAVDESDWQMLVDSGRVDPTSAGVHY